MDLVDDEPKTVQIRLAVKTKEINELHHVISVARNELAGLYDRNRTLEHENSRLKQTNNLLK